MGGIFSYTTSQHAQQWITSKLWCHNASFPYYGNFMHACVTCIISVLARHRSRGFTPQNTHTLCNCICVPLYRNNRFATCMFPDEWLCQCTSLKGISDTQHRSVEALAEWSQMWNTTSRMLEIYLGDKLYSMGFNLCGMHYWVWTQKNMPMPTYINRQQEHEDAAFRINISSCMLCICWVQLIIQDQGNAFTW